MPQHLLIEKKGPTLLITLNRPKVLNALKSELLKELKDAIEELQNDQELKGAILTGSGEKAFAAGADISEFASLSAAEAEAFSKSGQELFFRIENSPKPVIAAINGFALGGGCELAMACHMRVAAEHARFGQPEVNLGLLAGYGGTQRLVQLIGKGKATELLVTADMIGAEEAHRLGLANHVVSMEELLPKCEEILSKIYKKSPMAVKLTLEAVSDGVNGKDGYATEARNFGIAITSEDGKEGTSAFMEKRKPAFTGR